MASAPVRIKKYIKKNKKKQKKQKLGAPGSPYDGSPPHSSPLIAIGPFMAVWDGVGACENQK
jgi:hypothetical protein